MPLVHNQNNFCNFAMASRKICKDVEMKTYDFGIRSFGFQSLFSDFYVKKSIIQSQSLRQFCWLIFIQIENTLSIEKKNWTSIYDKSFLKSRLYLMPFFLKARAVVRLLLSLSHNSFLKTIKYLAMNQINGNMSCFNKCSRV
jgi:hypothetical protein